MRLPAFLSLIFVVSLCSCFGCGTTSGGPPPVLGGEEDAPLGPGDEITVTVVHEKELSGKHRLAGNGTIKFPLVGLVKMSGLMPTAAAKKLETELRNGFLKNPQVLVYVDKIRNKKIHVFGSVRRPGTFQYVNNMSIIEAITLAGGFTPLASKDSTRVTRRENGKKKSFTIAVGNIGKGTATNFVLRKGDVIWVPERVF